LQLQTVATNSALKAYSKREKAYLQLQHMRMINTCGANFLLQLT